MEMNVKLQYSSWKNSMRKLLSKGFDLDARNIEGMTGLHLASKEASFDNVKCLIKMGSDLQIRNNVAYFTIDYHFY